MLNADRKEGLTVVSTPGCLLTCLMDQDDIFGLLEVRIPRSCNLSSLPFVGEGRDCVTTHLENVGTGG